MNTPMTAIAAVVLLHLSAVAAPALAQTVPTFADGPQTIAVHPVRAAIDATDTQKPVSPYLYGMFIEPIDRLMDRTMWAEMLDDRKFYFPVKAEGQDTIPTRDGPMRYVTRRWRPIGGDNAVVMDASMPYASDQSASVTLAGAEVRGLSQTGLTLIAGKAYSGRIVLAAPASARVTVTLIWGDGPTERQSVTLTATGGKWKTQTFAVTPGASTDKARFEITGTGTGAFKVGAVSLMPADNIDGWRAEVVAQLKTIPAGMWRLPGGNYLSNWDWHDAIGPRDQRRPMFDHAWTSMQTNDIGLDEYMTLCRLIGVEPYITVNAGFGDANSAAEEVEYINGPASSYWGGQRARNGHPEPYGIKYWNIGNEPYGDWQIGKTSLTYYALKHIDFAQRMRRVDPSIVLIASGAMPDQRRWPGVEQENANVASIQPKFGTELDWTGGLFAKASDYFDGMTEHWYDFAEKRPDAPPAYELIEFVRQPSNNVRMKAIEWDIYRKTYPQIDQRDIFLSIDEYAYLGAPPNLKSAMAYAMVLQEMLRHSDYLRFGALTMGTATLDITPTAAGVNTTGLVYQLYGQHFGAGVVPVAVSGDTPWPDPRYPMGFDHPQVSAGSDTWPLDVVAGLSAKGDKLVVGVVNATSEARPLRLDVKGVSLTGKGRAYVMTASRVEAANAAGKPAEVSITPVDVALAGQSLETPPLSIVVYEFDTGAAQ